jgi:hypothetical protein
MRREVPVPAWITGDYGVEAARAAANFWSLADIPSTASRIRPAIDIALEVLERQQSSEGFWVHPAMSTYHLIPQSDRLELLPDSCSTAGATLLLLRFARKPNHRRAAERGVQWLLQNQMPGGWWEYPRTEPGTMFRKEACLEATCIALRALVLQDHVDPMEQVRRGVEWLIAQQDDYGGWDDLPGFPQHHYTVMAIDTLRICGQGWHRSAETSPYLATALRLLERTREFLAVDDDGSSQIALILAFQAVELFLYSCLELPEVNVPVFADKSATHTIGYEKALTQLQENLRSRGRLAAGAHVQGQPKLARLKYLRDQIVHKGMVAPVTEVRPAVSAAERLIRDYCPEYHGFSPLGW